MSNGNGGPPDRRRAIFPEPAQPGPEQEQFAPYPHVLTQPGVPSGLLMGGQPAREQGAGMATTEIAGTQPYTEGRELRPPGALLKEGQGWTVFHEHHHTVNVMEQGKRAHHALRLRMDPNNAIRILATDSQRWRATVLNLSTSTSTVTIGDERVAAGGDAGFDLAPGASQDVNDEAEVWAAIPSGGAATLCLWITRSSPYRGETQSGADQP